MQITEVKGDLLTDAGHLVHCVSQDFRMGAGIALQIKNRFKQVNYLISQRKQIGQVAILEESDRFIFYLVTKDRYFNKPTYDNLRNTLIELLTICKEKNIDRLAMCKIGCGLDKLEWKTVKDLIKKVFLDTGINIIVYSI